MQQVTQQQAAQAPRQDMVLFRHAGAIQSQQRRVSGEVIGVLTWVAFWVEFCLPNMPWQMPAQYVMLKRLAIKMLRSQPGEDVYLTFDELKALRASVPRLPGALMLDCLPFYESMAMCRIAPPMTEMPAQAQQEQPAEAPPAEAPAGDPPAEPAPVEEPPAEPAQPEPEPAKNEKPN